MISDEFKKALINLSVNKTAEILAAISLLAIGFLLARWIGRIVDRGLEKRDLEPPLRILIVRLVRLLVFVAVLLTALDKMGIPILPMMAGLGVVGVGIGLALQGVLGNLVAGFVIIFTKPFRVNEYVEIVGVHGVVTHIDLLATTLEHGDLSKVKVPNRKIIGEILHNYGKIRQLDIMVGVSYNADSAHVIATIQEILRQNPRVLQSPAPGVGIASLGDSAVNIAVKPWVALTDFGPAGGEINQAILETFRTQKIEIPFPQREIRLLNGGNVLTEPKP